MSKVGRMLFIFIFTYVIGLVTESLGYGSEDTTLELENPTDGGVIEGIWNTMTAFFKLLTFQYEIPAVINIPLTTGIAIVVIWTVAEMIRGN